MRFLAKLSSICWTDIRSPRLHTEAARGEEINNKDSESERDSLASLNAFFQPSVLRKNVSSSCDLKKSRKCHVTSILVFGINDSYGFVGSSKVVSNIAQEYIGH